jgi:acid phosphatase type 7
LRIVDKSANLVTLEASGLQPKQRYLVKFKAGSTELSVKFVTAPAAADASEPFSFLVYGDNRTDDGAHKRVASAMDKYAGGDFLVHTGDFVATGSSKEDWRTFFAAERGLLAGRPILSCVGNHELWANGGVEYAKYFAPGSASTAADPKSLRSVARWGNTQFIFLNAMTNFEGEEKTWAKTELEKARADATLQHRIVVLHHGPFSSGPHGGNRPFIAAGMLNILRDNNVDLVLSGHDHIYERGVSSSLRYIVSGGGGAPAYEVNSKIAGSEKVEPTRHFVHVTVAGPEVRIRTVRTDGSLLEACSFASGGGWTCEGQVSKPTSSAPPQTAKSPCGCNQPGGGVHQALSSMGLALAVLLAIKRRARKF